MKVLLVGGGGREHALGWKLAQSGRLTSLTSAPGNPGLAEIGAVEPELGILDAGSVAAWAVEHSVDLVVVGPEAPLAAGVADVLIERGIAVFGPTSEGARLESSKAYAKEIMTRVGVPTAAAHTFDDAEAAASHLERVPGPFVVKADGLAAGKGVLVTEDVFAAQGWARLCLGGHFGPAGSRVVIEEHLAGDEVSVFFLCDGERAVSLEPARDYKRLADGDEGPNTGGMGCYSPVDDLPDDLAEWTRRAVVEPVLGALRDDGITYRGFLYVGLMLTADGPKVLEFNCRMGDPETQVVLPRLDEDLLALLAGPLPDRPLRWSGDAAVNVVLASGGYPEAPETGEEIAGVEAAAARDGVLVFHAGTRRENGALVTAGGRVLNVVGLGRTVAEARKTAYDAVDDVRFTGMQYRTDIARDT